VEYTFFSQIRKYDVLTPLHQMWALCIHRLSIRRCCELPRRSACLALRTSSVETLRHRTCGSKKIERWFAAPVARRTQRCCKLSRRSACVALRASSVETLRHRTCGSKKIERRLAAPELRVFLRHGRGLPRRFPCLVLRASSVETLYHRTCGIRKRSRRLQCCFQTFLTIY
jgi:hypothetical protein